MCDDASVFPGIIVMDECDQYWERLWKLTLVIRNNTVSAGIWGLCDLFCWRIIFLLTPSGSAQLCFIPSSSPIKAHPVHRTSFNLLHTNMKSCLRLEELWKKVSFCFCVSYLTFGCVRPDNGLLSLTVAPVKESQITKCIWESERTVCLYCHLNVFLKHQKLLD